MPIRNSGHVVIMPHARERAAERFGGMKLSPGKLRKCIRGALGAGAKVENGCIKVSLGQGRYAVCAPEPQGGWAVLTVCIENDVG